MGRVSQSKQNNYGKGKIQTPSIQLPVRQERSRRDMRTSATPAAVQSRNPVEGVPTRPSQPTGGVEIPAFSYYDQARKANPEGTTRNFGEGYKEKELAAGQAAENSRAGAGFGSEQRVSPTGVVQTGTSTSPKPMTMDDANKLLSDGYKINTTYASNQLPTTASSPYAGKGNAEIYNPDTLHQHVQGTDYVTLSKNLFEDRSGVETYQRGKNMNADYKQMDVNPGESVPEEKVNWANRTMADNSDSKLARRRAFLDAKGSMQGLRDSEAVQGISYRGGNHYIADGKGGDSLTKVENKDDMRTYKSGEEGARQIRDKYVNALTSKGDSPAPLPDSEQQASNVEASSNQKPLTVAPNDIPSDLSGEAGEAYLRKLDAGQLTRKR